ncbi:hypothetical protein [Sinorhizobium fredii]|uniref:hypothetical protein n=1 Tax=Rhizobium fredii TaxID=380 RepID=UPI0035145782
MPILIHGEVKCIVAGNPYQGVIGVVKASKATTAGIEHQVEFPRRVYTPEEIDRGEDQDPVENIVWLLESEIQKTS